MARSKRGPGEFDEGFLLGVLVGEGHFGGDGRQPQVTLRMHVRHERLFRWIEERFPGGRLYGPYHHGGRDYYQWMARGEYLRARLLPLLVSRRDWMDGSVRARFDAMCDRYALKTGPAAAPSKETQRRDPKALGAGGRAAAGARADPRGEKDVDPLRREGRNDDGPRTIQER